jgi:hypothetical protein
MKVVKRSNGVFAIQNKIGSDAPAYYQTEAEANEDMNQMPSEIRTAFEEGSTLGDDDLVVAYFSDRGTIPYWDARKIIEREAWRPYQVQAASVDDFLARYYKPERYGGRGEEYATILRESHQADFERDGFDIISRHDSVTGQMVAYLGDH